MSNVNKVVLGDKVLLDLTGDNVQPENVDEGITFHTADGEQRQGAKVVDTEMSDTSTNAVQNKVIKAYVDNNTGSKATVRSNISVNVTPVAMSSYCAWDTEELYGYKAVVTINGLTENSLIENLVMSDTLLSSVGYIATTGTNSLTFYTQDDTPLSGLILTLVTSEVE